MIITSMDYQPQTPFLPSSSPRRKDTTLCDPATQREAGASLRPLSRSLVQSPVPLVWPSGRVLLSAARGKRPSGIPGAPDTVACGPSRREDREATPHPRDNQDQILASDSLQHHGQGRSPPPPLPPAPGSLKTQRQDFLGLGLGLEEGRGWRREIQESAGSLSRRNPHNNKISRLLLGGQRLACGIPALCQVLWDTMVTKQTWHLSSGSLTCMEETGME